MSLMNTVGPLTEIKELPDFFISLCYIFAFPSFLFFSCYRLFFGVGSFFAKTKHFLQLIQSQTSIKLLKIVTYQKHVLMVKSTTINPTKKKMAF